MLNYRIKRLFKAATSSRLSLTRKRNERHFYAWRREVDVSIHWRIKDKYYLSTKPKIDKIY